MLMNVWDGVEPPIHSIHEPCRRSRIIYVYFTSILQILYEILELRTFDPELLRFSPPTTSLGFPPEGIANKGLVGK